MNNEWCNRRMENEGRVMRYGRRISILPVTANIGQAWY